MTPNDRQKQNHSTEPLAYRVVVVPAKTPWIQAVKILAKMGATIYGQHRGQITRVWVDDVGWIRL